jgi:hypothetical protein
MYYGKRDKNTLKHYNIHNVTILSVPESMFIENPDKTVAIDGVTARNSFTSGSKTPASASTMSALG